MKNEKAIKQMSLGHLAKYIERESKKMEANGNQPWQIAEHSLKISKAYGIDLPESLVKYPAGHHKAQKENGGIGMFKFNQVLDQVTGERYDVTSATFMGEDYDNTLDGANWYSLDLTPADMKQRPVYDVDLVIHNDGRMDISKNLHGERSKKEYDERFNMSVSEIIAIEAIIDGATLIIPKESEKKPLKFSSIDHAKELEAIKSSHVHQILHGSEEDDCIRIIFEDSSDHLKRELRICENGLVFLSERF